MSVRVPMTREDIAQARDWALRAMADLCEQTGDSRNDYYTRAAANWIPDLCAFVQALSAEIERLDDDVIECERRTDAAFKEAERYRELWLLTDPAAKASA